MKFDDNDLEKEIYAQTLYSCLNDLNYRIKPPTRRLKIAVYADKLEELSLTIKCMLADSATDLSAMLNRTATMNGIKEVKPDNLQKVYDLMLEDYKAAEFLRHKKCHSVFNEKENVYLNDVNPIREVTTESIAFLKEINKNIADLQVCVKGGDAAPKFNKTSYKEICKDVYKASECFFEQDGANPPDTRNFFVDGIKKLKMLKTTYLKLFNKYFGDESPFACFDLYSKYICKYMSD